MADGERFRRDSMSALSRIESRFCSGEAGPQIQLDTSNWEREKQSGRKIDSKRKRNIPQGCTAQWGMGQFGSDLITTADAPEFSFSIAAAHRNVQFIIDLAMYHFFYKAEEVYA